MILRTALSHFLTVQSLPIYTYSTLVNLTGPNLNNATSLKIFSRLQEFQFLAFCIQLQNLYILKTDPT